MDGPDPKVLGSNDITVVGVGSEHGSTAATYVPTARLNGAPLLAPGATLMGRYTVLEMLGEGGMGAVYRAQDLELDRVVALKVIRPDLAADPAILQRFKQEVVLARQVAHKNVVRTFDLGEADGVRFITMEFVEGRSLESLLKERGKLPPAEAADIISQVCRGLEAAHAEGVVHRDLKPSNIMRDEHGRVAVMDFGLARSVQTDGITQTGMLVGTIEYMSPEQAKGEHPDARSDLFAVGLIFYELLTGQRPYAAESSISSLLKRTRERATPANQVDSSVPRALSDIVSKCLEIDAKHRYQNAGEMLADLERWRAGHSLTAVRLTNFKRRVRGWQVALVLGILALAVAVPVAVRRLTLKPIVPHAPVSVLVADFQNATGEPVFAGTLEPAVATALEAAPFINAFRRGTAHRIAAELRPGAATMDEDLARLVAGREGVNVVVSGTVAKAGSGYRVAVRAVDAATGKLLVQRELSAADRDAVLAAVGPLTAPVRTQLGDTTPESAQLAAAETFTAASLEAAHQYAVAQDLFDRGKAEEAMDAYKKAIAADPNLARAYAGLAIASVNLKKPDEAADYYKKALGLLDHMSEREKYRTLGHYYSAFMHNYPQAIETYERLVFLFPGDGAAYNNLSIAYVFTLDFQKAIAAIKRAIELSPQSVQGHLNYALYSMYAGDFSTAITEAQEIVRQDSSYEYAYLPLGLSLLARGDVKGAREVYGRLENVSPDTYSMAKIGEADLELYLGQYQAALKALDAGIARDTKNGATGEAALKYVAKAEALLAAGHKAEALQAARRAVQLNAGEESLLYPAARVFIAAGEDAQARKIATQLNGTLQTQSRSWAQLIEGELALQHRDFPAAVDAFRNGQKLHNSWMSHFLLGRAYLEAGHFGEALAEFETCKTRQGETADLMFADSATLRYLPPLFYWTGRAQQGLGLQAPAQESFKKFIELRGSSDIKDPMVEDAKRATGGAASVPARTAS